MRPPTPTTSERPSKSLRGGTRWTTALTVVSTIRERSPLASASRVIVSMRRLAISALGDTRS
jgi:hypothetical protein